jgi:hypothetical protein
MQYFPQPKTINRARPKIDQGFQPSAFYQEHLHIVDEKLLSQRMQKVVPIKIETPPIECSQIVNVWDENFFTELEKLADLITTKGFNYVSFVRYNLCLIFNRILSFQE